MTAPREGSPATAPAALAFRVARAADADAVANLVNTAYRGDSSRRGWTTETDLVGGPRTDADWLAEIVATPGNVVLLALRGELLVGCVHLESTHGGGAFLGMLTVRPDLQAAGLGRQLLAAAERLAAKALGAVFVELTVLDARTELVAWYERRGYGRTDGQRAFPYGDSRYGLPKRPDLRFVVLRKALRG